MIRIQPVKSAKRAELYYPKTDGGYYLKDTGLRCEWGGKAAARLGLDGPPELEEFKNLINGLDPHTGEQLTARLRGNRLPAWDVTASVPKGVTTALERGDDRVHEAIWRAWWATFERLESYATTRIRVGGQQDERVTGSLVCYAVEHADTRPVEDKAMPKGHRWRAMPLPDRHIHGVVANLTWDDAEDKWKAVKFRPIMDLRKFFDRHFDSLLASEMSSLGYEIETKFKPDGKGGSKYYSWDIKGMPASVLTKFSRRSEEIARLEREIVAENKKQDKYAPDHLSPTERDKLGAISRLLKRDDLTLEECRGYWDILVTKDEAAAIAATIERARSERNPRPEPMAGQAVDFAMRHHFERESAVPMDELAVTALERSMGAASPEDIEREFARRGVIVREIDGVRYGTTAALQEEERRMAAFAANGLGSVSAIDLAPQLDRRLASGRRLNDGQWDAVTGLLESPNAINVILGPAGAGKSSMLAKFDEGARMAGQQVAYLATTAKAAEELQKTGFAATQTVARFLLDRNMQAAARGGRLVVDETSMLSHQDAVKLLSIAKRDDLKLIFVGDAMQHGSVDRGAFMRLLTEHGQVVPFKVNEIVRQTNSDYRAAAQLLSEGRAAEGFAAMDAKGWVSVVASNEERCRRMAADYLEALGSGLKWDDVLLVSPTHADGEHITQELRALLRDAGKLGKDEHQFTRLVQVDRSEAERSTAQSYQPGEVVVFHQNAKGGFVKGQRMVITDPADVPVAEAAKFSVYRQEAVGLAVGDVLRFTGTVKTEDSKHTLRNGAVHAIAEFTPGGNIRLENGWVVRKDAGHFRFGYVETSMGAQGRNVEGVIVGMPMAGGAAVNMQQFYVSASRAKKWLKLYTDDKDGIKEAIQRDSRKLLALDLKTDHKPERKTPPDRMREQRERKRRLSFVDRLRGPWDRARLQPERMPHFSSAAPAANTQRQDHDERDMYHAR
jgi:conjugative relaxase-like TrwC/TraI family protein